MGLPRNWPTPGLTRSMRSAMISTSLSDPFNLKYDRGSGGFDRRHIFNVELHLQPAVFRAQFQPGCCALPWEAGSSPGSRSWQSGTPHYIQLYRPRYARSGRRQHRRTVRTWWRRSPTQRHGWPGLAPALLQIQSLPGMAVPNQGFGNAGRDAVVGPGLFNFNLSLFKTIAIHGRRAET